MKFLVWTEAFSDDVRANGVCCEFISETNDEVESPKLMFRVARMVMRTFQRDGKRAWIEVQDGKGTVRERFAA